MAVELPNTEVLDDIPGDAAGRLFLASGLLGLDLSVYIYTKCGQNGVCYTHGENQH